MRILIVGGGKVGFYLAQNLAEHGHKPVMVEPVAANCERIANTLDIPVIRGDGTMEEALAAAECGKSQALVAVTGDDESNLVCCQIAKRVFHCPKTVARVNNPKNAPVLRQLGVDIAVSSTDILGRLLEREVETAAIRQVLNLAGGTASLTEILIPPNFKYQNKMLSEIKVPADTIMVSVTRGDHFIIPRGSTQLQEGDKVLCLAKETALHELTMDWKLQDK